MRWDLWEDVLKTYIGIDNGTSGSIGIIASEHTHYQEMPTFKARSYTVKEKHISRVDVLKLMQVIKTYTGNSEKVAILERPMVNPGRFTATISAVRALEATLIVLEQLRIPVVYVDSKKWQKMFLPPQSEDKKLRKKGVERTKEIKE